MKATNSTRDPLAAVPVIPEGVEAKADHAELLQLRRTCPPRSRLGRFLARKLGPSSRHRVNLDEHGTYFWKQIDGRRDLAEISRRLCNRYGLGKKDGNDAVVSFTAMLMRRGLIGLSIEE